MSFTAKGKNWIEVTAKGGNPSPRFAGGFDGAIDDVMAFSRPLSEMEVKKIFEHHK